MRTLNMRESPNGRALLDYNARSEHDMGFHDNIAAEPGIVAEEHKLGRNEGRASTHCRLTEARLHGRLGSSQLGAIVHTHHLGLAGNYETCHEAHLAGNLD